jgi:Domain of unknown function (DUF4258)
MHKTTHFKKMLSERNILDQWVDRTLSDPDKIEDHADGTRHYLKQIREHDNRWLRVIVSFAAEGPRAVTVFYDRRLRGIP